jgi:hypothetical protein
MIGAKVSGIPDLKAALAGIVPKLRRQALRNALAAGARIVRNHIRARTPVLKLSTYSGASAMRRGVRKPGTVRDAISVRTSKRDKRAGNVGVFVNVRPNPISAKSPDDPYYWRWINFGRKAATRKFKIKGLRRRNGLVRRSQTGAYAGAHFLEEGANMLMAALEKFKTVIGPQIEKLNRKGGTP